MPVTCDERGVDRARTPVAGGPRRGDDIQGDRPFLRSGGGGCEARQPEDVRLRYRVFVVGPTVMPGPVCLGVADRIRSSAGPPGLGRPEWSHDHEPVWRVSGRGCRNRVRSWHRGLTSVAGPPLHDGRDTLTRLRPGLTPLAGQGVFSPSRGALTRFPQPRCCACAGTDALRANRTRLARCPTHGA